MFFRRPSPRESAPLPQALPRPSFEERVRRHQDRVFSFAMHYLRDQAEAEDVTQEVLIRLWRYDERLDEAQLVGWLLRVTRNACTDAARRRARAPEAAGHTPLLEDAPSDGLAPDEHAERGQFRQAVEEALHGLAEPYRSIVMLREVEDLTYDDISAALGLPLNTVKVYLHRGRRQLRETLSKVIDREHAYKS